MVTQPEDEVRFEAGIEIWVNARTVIVVKRTVFHYFMSLRAKLSAYRLELRFGVLGIRSVP